MFLISRTQSKLDQTSEELKKKYPKIRVGTHAVDFSKFDEAAEVRRRRQARLANCISISVRVALESTSEV